jgi:hypothetical protein
VLGLNVGGWLVLRLKTMKTMKTIKFNASADPPHSRL